MCVPFGARVDAGLLSERPARGWWQIDATCQRYGCKFIATSAKEDKVNGKCQEAVDVASILSAYPAASGNIAAAKKVAAAEAAVPPAARELRPGDEAVVHDMQGLSAQYNGAACEVIAFNEKKGRFKVQSLDTGRPMFIKPENLLRTDGGNPVTVRNQP